MKPKIKRKDVVAGYVNTCLQYYGIDYLFYKGGKIIILKDDEHYKIVKVGITESAMALPHMFKNMTLSMEQKLIRYISKPTLVLPIYPKIMQNF